MKTYQRAFTLLEILLVLALLSVSAVAVIATLPNNQADMAKQNAQALYQRVQLLNEEAILSGKDYGLRVDEKQFRYELLMLTLDGWQPLELADIPSQNTLPEDVSIQLTLGGNVWGNDDRLFTQGSLFDEDMFADIEDKKTIRPPQVFIVSSGEITPATIALFPSSGDAVNDSWKVISKDNGEIVLLAPGEIDESL